MTALPSTMLTYDDLVAMPDDGRRHELIDGVLYVSPAPVPLHARVLRRLFLAFHTAATENDAGEVFFSPLDVFFDEHSIVEPDLLYVRADRVDTVVGSKYVSGPPDIVVEGISPSSVRHDRVHKFNLYERAGVPEYWIVNPEKREISVHVLVNGRYESSPAYPDGTFGSRELPGLRIDPKNVF